MLEEYTKSCSLISRSEDLKYMIELKTLDLMITPGLVPTNPSLFELEKQTGEVF